MMNVTRFSYGLVALIAAVGCASGHEDFDAGTPDPTEVTTSTVEPLVLSGGWWLTDQNYVGQTQAIAAADFDRDGKDDLVMCRLGYGCGTIGFDATNRMRSNLVQSAGTPLGSGASFARQVAIRAVADFTGDGFADAIAENMLDEAHMSSAPNQQLVLTRDPATYGFRALTATTVGTTLTGGYRLDSLSSSIGVGDFDHDARQDVLTMGSNGITVLSASAVGSLYASTFQAVGTAAGRWTVGPSDGVTAVGDANGDGQTDVGILSPSGIGVLTRDPITGKFKELAIAANGTNIGGGYVLNHSHVVGFGNFDDDPEDEVMLARWCPTCADLGNEYAIADVKGGTFKLIAWAPEGTMTTGGWRLGGSDSIDGASGNRFVDYDGDGRADFIVQSAWGVGVMTLGTFYSASFPFTSYRAFKTIALVPWGTNVGGHVMSASGHGIIAQPGHYMGLGRYEFLHMSTTELAFIGVGPSGFETLARAGLDHEATVPMSIPPQTQPPPPPPATCSKSSFQFCWRNTVGGAVPAAAVTCDIDSARSKALALGTPGGYSACPECHMFDGACPKPACSAGTPTYAEMCCPTTGTTYSGVGCSVSEAQSFAKKGDTGCTSWVVGTCPL